MRALVNTPTRSFGKVVCLLLFAACVSCGSNNHVHVLREPLPPPGIDLPSNLEDTTGYPRVVLWLEADGAVNRTAVLNDNGKALQWVIVRDGRTVLKRNARNETQYRYFIDEPGVYTIYMSQFVDGAYRVISNIVSYRIE